MIQFVNAKLNIGLHITSRRPDGYHNLETIFYPVGKENGTPANPEPFCDILEITPSCDEDKVTFTGREIACEPQQNLVCKALTLFHKETKVDSCFNITLDKHLPDGAGLGGGSADASFTLLALNELSGNPLSHDDLSRIALSLGADCPFFLLNSPAYASGVGEVLTEVESVLSGLWAVIVKPSIYISTREAFAGITLRDDRPDLRTLIARPIDTWRTEIVNDFEASLFPTYPLLQTIKENLYLQGAMYASMTGTGSSIYGIFADRASALIASESSYFDGCFVTISKL